MKARKAVFSGSWYPSGADECEKEIKQFLADKSMHACLKKDIKGGIVPHAGWYFSGSIACNVINCLTKEEPPDVIFIFGMHLHADSSPYIMLEGSWETPFGELPIAGGVASDLADQFNFMIETTTDFTQDNTIELQLPFVKYLFDDVKIVPVGVPPSDLSIKIGRYAAKIAEKHGVTAKVIGSTDLTHYGSNYGFSPKGLGSQAHEWVRTENDRSIIDAMLRMDAEEVLEQAENKRNACCAGAAAAAISAAKSLGSQGAESVAYTTSYEKSPGESFVGYAGVVF
ncbi:MAG: AmmeMemoRadiSam system protein B [Deltaproteobacteria bacterium]|nr:AmmeMemoRadiSam system protein B [Deltaproteobacteria bacterium]